MKAKSVTKLISNTVRNSSKHDVLIIVLTSLLLASLLYILLTDSEPFCNELFSQSEKKTIFIFLMDGCGWCTKFKPEVSVLTSRVSEDSSLQKKFDVRVINFPSVSPSDKQLMRDFSVDAFPAIVLSTSDQAKFWNYHGSEERSAERILQWAQNIGSQTQ